MQLPFPSERPGRIKGTLELPDSSDESGWLAKVLKCVNKKIDCIYEIIFFFILFQKI